MKRITTLSFALLTAFALAGAGCNKRDDTLPAGAPGAGPGTTTSPSDTTTTSPGGMSTTPGGGMTTTPGGTTPATPSDSTTGTPGSMGGTGSTTMPPASAASQ